MQGIFIAAWICRVVRVRNLASRIMHCNAMCWSLKYVSRGFKADYQVIRSMLAKLTTGMQALFS